MTKEALAQPEERNFCQRCGKRTADLTAIHTCTLPQRQWVGLTDTERNDIWKKEVGWGDPSHDDEDLMKAIEQALKDKNT